MPVKAVFLSSTGRDLAAHREAAYHAIAEMEDWQCVRMEDFGARGRRHLASDIGLRMARSLGNDCVGRRAGCHKKDDR
jgi:hypothetical protein